jgi:hypothetical protein
MSARSAMLLLALGLCAMAYAGATARPTRDPAAFHDAPPILRAR